MKTLLVVLLVVLLVAVVTHAGGAETIYFACTDGVCVISEENADRLAEYVRLLQDAVISLRAKTGCT